MNAYVSICFLLSCMSFGLVVRAKNRNRYALELVSMRSNLSMYNDKHDLVPITTNQNPNQKYLGRITFFYYTRNNGQVGQEIRINRPDDLAKAGFMVDSQTYFITHGWLGTNSSLDCTLIRNAYINNTFDNVIVVDWSKYSYTLNYLDAVSKVKTVSRAVSDMIKYLYTQRLTWDKITLIGFSLGAHVMGIAGYNVEPKVKQIVGLDPALPMFNFAGPGEALTHKDAKNVQIIHTNAGGLGYLCPNGHTDFFPNGGAQQEGCCYEFANAANAPFADQVRATVECAACSHYRAFQYFAESITNTFNATQCSSLVLFENNYCANNNPHFEPMGGLEPFQVVPGTYYLRTGAQLPYNVPFTRATSSVDLSPLYTDALCMAIDQRY